MNTIKKIVIYSAISIITLVAAGMAGCPQYDVWQSHKAGEAELAKATANRKIRVQEAEAQHAAAVELAAAEVERAKGVAQANKIVGESLKGNEVYLKYLWLHTLGEGHSGQIIYIPTEANLPILEAGRTAINPNTK